MPQAVNPESAAPVETQGRALPNNAGPNNAGAAARGSWLSNEILTMISVGIALAMLLVTLLNFTNDRIDRVEVRIDRLETRLDARIDNLDAKIDKLDAKFEAKFDALDAKFDALDAKFDALLLQLTRSNAISAQGTGRDAKPR